MTTFIPILNVFPNEAVFLNAADVKHVRLVKGSLLLFLFNGEQYSVYDEKEVRRIVKILGGLAGLSEEEITEQLNGGAGKKEEGST